MNESIITKASEIAAKRIMAAVDRAKEIVLETYTGGRDLKSILGPLEDLSSNQIKQLAAIYHNDEEPYPCQFCQYIAKEKMRQRKEGIDELD